MEAVLEISNNDLGDFIELTSKLYGIDFSGYAQESLRRRILRLMKLKSCDSFMAFKYFLTNQSLSEDELLIEITVNTTEMFRDYEVFKFLGEEVFGLLETYPRINIWHAGCSTGQEPMSLAILLKERGLLRRSVQYCTDINAEVLNHAKKGIYDLKEVKEYSANYIKSGGELSLSDYYVANYGKVKMNKELSKNMVFTKHNLVNGSSFNQMHMIMCRNVFIYLTTEQQNKVLRLFLDSLVPRGYLVLGAKESAVFSPVLDELEVINGKLKIYRKRDDQDPIKVVLFCGSAGAINVLERFLKDVDHVPKVAMVVVLHRKTSMRDHLVGYLESMVNMKVEPIEHGIRLNEGVIYVAPAGYHCILEKDMSLSLDLSEKVMFSRPSADVSLESFSHNLRERLIAIVVSGANADGADGAKWVVKRNGKVIVQNPAEAFAKAMPGAVIEAVEQVDHIVTADEMYRTAAKYF